MRLLATCSDTSTCFGAQNNAPSLQPQLREGESIPRLVDTRRRSKIRFKRCRIIMRRARSSLSRCNSDTRYSVLERLAHEVLERLGCLLTVRVTWPHLHRNHIALTRRSRLCTTMRIMRLQSSYSGLWRYQCAQRCLKKDVRQSKRRTARVRPSK